MNRLQTSRAKIACLAVGAFGGCAFYFLHAPLPWMLGAMCATTLAAMSGVRVQIMPRVRQIFIAILGVMLGSAFTPDILDGIQRWSGSFLWLGIYVIASTSAIRWFFLRLGYDPVSAFFAAAPGGLSEMTLAGAAFGGDERRISLSHGARILIAVFTLSFGYRIFGGFHPGAGAGTNVATPLDVEAWLMMAAAGLAGFFLAKWLRVPAFALVGPMIASAIIHALGITHARPPVWLIGLAQLVVGSMIGARFDGVRPREVLSAVAAAAAATAILLLIAMAFGWIVQVTVGIPFAAALLAFAPGGLAEMSLIAYSLNIDSAYVSSHHVIRIFIIVMLAPAMFRLWRARSQRHRL